MGEIRAVAKAMEIPEAGLIFAAIKPPGMTSHDVVDFMRRLCGTRRCGHAGTLDPAACGVLVLLVGRATRLSPHIMAYEKSYIVEVTFGLATDTGDVEGRVIEERPAEHVTEQRVREALSEICGVLVMKPHKYSAVKLAGRKAYEAARAGEQVELEGRSLRGPDELARYWEALAAKDGDFTDRLIAMAKSDSPTARAGACAALGHLGERAAAGVRTLRRTPCRPPRSAGQSRPATSIRRPGPPRPAS